MVDVGGGKGLCDPHDLMREYPGFCLFVCLLCLFVGQGVCFRGKEG